jgi:hypothetical protein
VEEIKTFHRLAMMFGLYYARIHAKGLEDHKQASYTLGEVEIADIVNVTREFFRRKPFLSNTATSKHFS